MYKTKILRLLVCVSIFVLVFTLVGCGKKKDREKLELGLFPQTHVTDSAIISQLNAQAEPLPKPTKLENWNYVSNYGDDTSRDRIYYIDVNLGNDSYRGIYYTDYRPYSILVSSTTTAKSYQEDNGYEAKVIHWFKYEPISWVVLDNKDGKKLITTELLIDSKVFDLQTSSYYQSYIHNYLNTDFLAYFSDNEEAKMAKINIDNSSKTTGLNDFVNGIELKDCEGKMFLLSNTEVKEYFISNKDRKAQATDYAKCMGIYVKKGVSYWWLRSPFNEIVGFSQCVTIDGKIGERYATCNVTRGLRPCVYINE